LSLEIDFDDYVAARQRRLLQVAWLLTGDWPAAEDLVQITLLKVWRSWRRAVAVENLDAYVRRTLINSFISSRRRRWRHETAVAHVPDVAEENDAIRAVLDGVWLARALSRLPRRQRAVLVLRFLEDQSEADVAEALGCSRGTVKSQTAKALANLRVQPELKSIMNGAGHVA
jgi:RNA polymerase sigma-70 factor (sigma-E family)